MFEENEIVKMRNFIKKLIDNPCFKNDTPLSIENNIIQFFIQNIKYLKTVFSTKEYFPNLSYIQIQSLFHTILIEKINSILIPQIKEIILSKINFQFLNIMLNREISLETFRNETTKIINKIINKREVRNHFDSLIKIFNNDIIEKYLNEIYDKKGYIQNEFTSIEKIKLSQELLDGLIKIILIVSLIGFIKEDTNDTVSIRNSKNFFSNYDLLKKKYTKILKLYFGNLSMNSEELIKKAVSFHLSFNEDSSIPATSRFAKIIFLLGKNYTNEKDDNESAENYEKSWFHSQIKNYKYFGLDINMLNELKQISTEKNW